MPRSSSTSARRGRPSAKKVAGENRDAKPKNPRPKDWSPDFVLRWLELNPGGALARLIELLVKATPGCKSHNLIADITGWRNTDPEFSKQYTALMTGRRNAGRVEQDLEMVPGLENWAVQWAIAYLETRSFGEACRQVGVPLAKVNNLTLRTSPKCDEKLADLREQVERVIVSYAEETVWKALDIARINEDAKTMGWIAIQALERLDKQRWSRQTNIEHSGTIRHEHEVTLRRQRAAMDQASRISAHLAPHMVEPDRKALPEGTPVLEVLDVVDAEYVEVE